jgi:hypothetical protein
VQEEKSKGGTWELLDLDYVVSGDFGKLQLAWHENVNLEILEARFITASVPVQFPPRISAVSCRSSVETVVL